MRYSTSVTEVARHFSDYLNRVAFRGERFVLMRGKRAMAELIPISTGRPLKDLPGLLASLPHLGAEDAASYAADIEAARAELAHLPLRDPWES
jgi:antitoxin (DNA-binding transcriptional repressor) of toxin-antitoxin stability system